MNANQAVDEYKYNSGRKGDGLVIGFSQHPAPKLIV
jgi:hypothetical protein